MNNKQLLLFLPLLIFSLLLSGCALNEGAGVRAPAAEVDETAVITDSTVLTATQAITATGSTTDTGMTNAPAALILGYAFMDADFVNADGAISGEIEDLLIDITNGQILFASIEYGGFLNIGGKEIIVPLSAFTWRSLEDDLILNVDEQALSTFPDLTEGWLNPDNPAWDDQVVAFWRNVNLDPGFDFAAAANTVVWTDDLLGYCFVDLGAGVDTIQNMLIDLTTSRVNYLLIGFGTGAADTAPFMIPFRALEVSDIADNQIAFNANLTLAMLQTAPRFDRVLFHTTGELDPVLDDAADQYWQEQGFTSNPEE